MFGVSTVKAARRVSVAEGLRSRTLWEVETKKARNSRNSRPLRMHGHLSRREENSSRGKCFQLTGAVDTRGSLALLLHGRTNTTRLDARDWSASSRTATPLAACRSAAEKRTKLGEDRAKRITPAKWPLAFSSCSPYLALPRPSSP